MNYGETARRRYAMPSFTIDDGATLRHHLRHRTCGRHRLRVTDRKAGRRRRTGWGRGGGRTDGRTTRRERKQPKTMAGGAKGKRERRRNSKIHRHEGRRSVKFTKKKKKKTNTSKTSSKLSKINCYRYHTALEFDRYGYSMNEICVSNPEMCERQRSRDVFFINLLRVLSNNFFKI